MSKQCQRLTAFLAVLLIFSANCWSNDKESKQATTFSIPLHSTPPKIDGMIQDNEWNGPSIKGFYQQSANLLEPRGGSVQITCDDSYLYVGISSPVHPRYGAIARFRSRFANEEKLAYDDSIELWLAPGPDKQPEKIYQLLVNSAGATFKQTGEPAISRFQKNWHPKGIKFKQQITNSIWTIELQIPLKNIGVTQISDGLRVRICRNYKLPFNQSRLCPGVTSYLDPTTMARIIVTEKAPIIIEPDCLKNPDGQLAATLKNPGKEALLLNVNGQEITLKPKENKDIPLKVNQDSEGGKSCSLTVTDSTGIVLHHRELKWKKPEKDLWEPVL